MGKMVDIFSSTNVSASDGIESDTKTIIMHNLYLLSACTWNIYPILHNKRVYNA